MHVNVEEQYVYKSVVFCVEANQSVSHAANTYKLPFHLMLKSGASYTFLKSPPGMFEFLLWLRGGGARGWGGTKGCRDGVFCADFMSRPPESCTEK